MTGDPGGSPDPLWVACGPIFRKNAGHGSCRMSALDMQYKEKRIFYAVVLLCVLPLFGRVRGCVASFGEGQSPCAPPGGYRPDLGRLREALRHKASGPFGAEPRNERKSRRKNRRFCGAGSLTTARSAGSCGVLKGRCSGREAEAMTLFSAKFGCLLRAARTIRGVPGLFERFKHE